MTMKLTMWLPRKPQPPMTSTFPSDWIVSELFGMFSDGRMVQLGCDDQRVVLRREMNRHKSGGLGSGSRRPNFARKAPYARANLTCQTSSIDEFNF